MAYNDDNDAKDKNNGFKDDLTMVQVEDTRERQNPKSRDGFNRVEESSQFWGSREVWLRGEVDDTRATGRNT